MIEPTVSKNPNSIIEVCCAVCSAPTTDLSRIWDDRYGYPGRHPRRKCAACGHIQIDVNLSAAEISDLYRNYYPRGSMSADSWLAPSEEGPLASWWKGSSASAYRWVQRSVRVLDIGCGIGESLGYHRGRDCEPHGVEADANVMKMADKHGLSIKIGLFDPMAYPAGYFDCVTLDQVLEHMSDPISTMKGIALVLRPGGTLVVSCPYARSLAARVFRNRWIHWHAPYHQHFFSRESMRKAAQVAGFTVVSDVARTPSAWMGFQWAHLVTFPREGEKSSFWSPQTKRTAAQKLLLKMLAVARRLGVDNAIARALDAVGSGDNRVWLLQKS